MAVTRRLHGGYIASLLRQPPLLGAVRASHFLDARPAQRAAWLVLLATAPPPPAPPARPPPRPGKSLSASALPPRAHDATELLAEATVALQLICASSEIQTRFEARFKRDSKRPPTHPLLPLAALVETTVALQLICASSEIRTPVYGVTPPPPHPTPQDD